MRKKKLDRSTVGGEKYHTDDWRERALARVTERQRASNRTDDRPYGIYMFMEKELKILIDECAERRDISLSGYARRAVAAMVAYDLGVPFEEVVKHAAMPNSYHQNRFSNRRVKQGDDGKGFGLWRILGLK